MLSYAYVEFAGKITSKFNVIVYRNRYLNSYELYMNYICLIFEIFFKVRVRRKSLYDPCLRSPHIL
jgi:hypothetical protein